VGSHTLTYRATQNGCTNTATRTFAINTAPPVPTLTIVQPTANTFGQITILNMPSGATSSLNNSPASTQTVYRNLGTGNYSLVIQNSCGRSNTTFTLRLTKNKLESENAIEMVNVYPNPAHDFMDIQLSEVPNEAVTLKLYNLLGMQMAEKEVLASESLHFECGQVPNGIYQLQVSQAGRRIASRQVVIQK
jgi:Secretion system C-terminal sorting domain